MVHSFGRLLQFTGLVILPVFILLEVTGSLGRDSGVADLLLAMAFGFCVFYVGRIMEGYARE